MTVTQIKKMIHNRIEDRNKILSLKPGLVSQVYLDRCVTELATLKSVLVEIYDIERRTQIGIEYDNRKKVSENYKVNIVS